MPNITPKQQRALQSALGKEGVYISWNTAERALSAALSVEAAASEAHPLAKFGSPNVAPLGLYRVHWKSGGSSLAAIGMMENGDRWIAPTNWIRPGTMPSAGEWGEIDRLEPITPAPAASEPVAWLVTRKKSGETTLQFKPPAYLPFNRANMEWEPLFK